MIAIATTKGTVLAFATPAEARGVAQQLIGEAEWFEEHQRSGPVLYMQRETAVPHEEAQKLLKALKGIPIEAVRGGE